MDCAGWTQLVPSLIYFPFAGSRQIVGVRGLFVFCRNVTFTLTFSLRVMLTGLQHYTATAFWETCLCNEPDKCF
jgi:hypothetical protein